MHTRYRCPVPVHGRRSYAGRVSMFCTSKPAQPRTPKRDAGNRQGALFESKRTEHKQLLAFEISLLLFLTRIRDISRMSVQELLSLLQTGMTPLWWRQCDSAGGMEKDGNRQTAGWSKNILHKNHVLAISSLSQRSKWQRKKLQNSRKCKRKRCLFGWVLCNTELTVELTVREQNLK